MAKIISILFLSIFFAIDSTYCQQQTTTTSTTTSSPSEIFDATTDGEYGNPGAQIRFSTSALDAIYKHALEKISQAIRSMIVPDVIVPVGGGMLTIKSVRITEASIANYDRQLIPPNRIYSRFTGGRIVSIGQWQYKPFNGARSIAQGIFRTFIVNAELNVTNQLGRTWDAKPMVNTQECKAYLGQFRVEIEGFGDNTTTIDQCENLLCKRIRSYFEESVCNTARNYIKETINQKLATFPTRINLGPTGNRFVLDYGLLMGEPKVTEQYIQAALEGDVLSRGTGSASFYAPDLSSKNDSQKMISFPLSDFVFNTLLFHAHNQQYRFSAFDLLSNSSSIKNWLRLNCSTLADQRRLKSMRGPIPSTRQMPMCLGSIFENMTTQYPSDAMGDLVFKSQRPLQVVVQPSPRKLEFSLKSSPARYLNVGGSIEIYGPIEADGKRELLGRADIQKLVGNFVPKMNQCNVTGTVNVSEIQLTQSTPTPARLRPLPEPALMQLRQLSTPIFTEMFNAFLNQFAQFPVPLLDGYECTSPEFRWMKRTMQIDCDVRVSPDATRTKN